MIRKFLNLCLLCSTCCLNFQLIADEEIQYALVAAADKRNINAAIFDRALASNKTEVQRQALLALGRIGGAASTLKLAPFLYSSQPDIRAMAAFALGINQDIKAHPLLVSRLRSEQHPVVISRLLVAIGNKGDDKGAIASILPFLNHQDDEIVAAACDGLTLAWSFYRDRVSIPNSTIVTRLMEITGKNERLAQHCLYTLSRIRTDAPLFNQEMLLSVGEKLTSDSSKVVLLKIMGAMANPAFLDFLSKSSDAANSLAVRAEAASAIALLPYQATMLPTLRQIAGDHSNQVKVNLIDNLKLTASDQEAIALIEQLMTDKSRWVRDRATLSLFAVKGADMKSEFMELLHSNEFHSQMLALDILQRHKLPDLQDYLKKLTLSTHPGIKRIATQRLLQQDKNPEIPSPANDTNDAIEAVNTAGKRFRILTTRGPISIQLMASTPYTGLNFYRLASAGYYDGLYFHRVIPNFVVQGGDPEGTGLGSPGYSIREELYPDSHERGTLGMATSGKDTAGGQFFFNNSDNFHLNSRYTIFARVTRGIELIDQIEAGDKIINIREITH